VIHNFAILLWATDPDRPHLCAAPFSHAAAAAAMDISVEIYFTSKSVRLLEKGIAQGIYAGNDRRATVYQFMQNAAELGAAFYACPEAAAAHGVDKENMIPEVTGFAGSAVFMSRVLDEAWRVVTY
jgi:predicted peroxiredoxin